MSATDRSFPHSHLLLCRHLFKFSLNPIPWEVGCFLPYVSLHHIVSLTHLQLCWDSLDKETRFFPTFHMKFTFLTYSELSSLTRVEGGHGLLSAGCTQSLSSSLISPSPSGITSKSSLLPSSVAPPRSQHPPQVSASILSNNQIMLLKTFMFSPIKRNPD